VSPADRRPWPESTLFGLYDAVPASEELDLAEEVHLERRALRWDSLCAAFFRALDARGEVDEAVEAKPEPEGGSLTKGQLLGLLEHLLGAQRIEEGQ